MPDDMRDHYSAHLVEEHRLRHEDDGAFEAMKEYQTKYHELLGAMLRIKDNLENPRSHGNYHDEEILGDVRRIVEELDI